MSELRGLGSAALAHFALGEFDDFGEALWSAVLHVLDPSSLHEDHDAAERAIGIFQVVTGLVLLFTFVAEVVANSLERLGQSDRPVTCHNHLLVVGGSDLASVAASAASEAQLETELKRLVVLAPESARDSRAQILDDLEEAGGDLKISLLFGDTAGDSGFELAEVGAETFAVTMIAPREAFDRYLGTALPRRDGTAAAQRPPAARRLHPAFGRNRGDAEPLRSGAGGRAGAPVRRRRRRSLRISAWRR